MAVQLTIEGLSLQWKYLQNSYICVCVVFPIWSASYTVNLLLNPSICFGNLLFSLSGNLTDSRYPLSNCMLSSAQAPAPALLLPHCSQCQQSVGPYLNSEGRGRDVLQLKFIALISGERREAEEEFTHRGREMSFLCNSL